MRLRSYLICYPRAALTGDTVGGISHPPKRYEIFKEIVELVGRAGESYTDVAHVRLVHIRHDLMLDDRVRNPGIGVEHPHQYLDVVRLLVAVPPGINGILTHRNIRLTGQLDDRNIVVADRLQPAGERIDALTTAKSRVTWRAGRGITVIYARKYHVRIQKLIKVQAGCVTSPIP